jgi:hypothetical protein
MSGATWKSMAFYRAEKDVRCRKEEGRACKPELEGSQGPDALRFCHHFSGAMVGVAS